MTAVFRPAANLASKVALLVVAAVVLIGAAFWGLWPRTDYARHVRSVVEQPVPFSHQHHVAGLGIDCRFCHSAAEGSSNAGLPPTHTCMTCHSQIWTNASLLAPVRNSLANQTPITWRRVTDLPDYVYFNHSIHIAKGVGCGSCHGEIETMPLTYDGNPEHPASLGAIDVYAQAQVLDFYDPDRAAEISQRGDPADRANLDVALSQQRANLALRQGAGLRILTGSVTSPTLIAQIEAVRRQYPEAKWTKWDPISRDAPREASRLAYGRPLDMIAYLDKADVLLAIDGDLLSSAPGRLRYARDFASRRNPLRTSSMSRVYAIESTPTLIGSVADHRFIAGPAELGHIVMALAAGVLHSTPTVSAPAWVGPLVADLRAARGRVLVHVGAAQPPELHALAHVLNEALGARGTTYNLIEPAAGQAALQVDAMKGLIADMHAGQVSHLLIIDSNPLYASPSSWGFAEALERVSFSVALARHADETARSTTWFVPQTHDWETWSDARAYDGTVTVLQPQALPLYGGFSAHAMLGLYLTAPLLSTEQRVRQTWAARLGGDSANGWSDALARGFVPGTANAPSDARLRTEGTAPSTTSTAASGDGLTLLLRV